MGTGNKETAPKNNSLFKASNNDLARLSAEELFIYFEIVELLLNEGKSQQEAEEAAYLCFFTK